MTRFWHANYMARLRGHRTPLVHYKFRVFLGVEINNLMDGNFKKHSFLPLFACYFLEKGGNFHAARMWFYIKDACFHHSCWHEQTNLPEDRN